MERRLTPEQLKLVIAEVQEMDIANGQEMSAAEVRDILQELNLPAELLEDAMVQVDRRQALASQQRRQRWLWGGVIAAAIVSIAISGISIHNDRQALSKVTAQADHVTLSLQDGNSRTEIDRQAHNQVFYRLTLRDAPLDRSLSLSCHWIDPNGKIAHQNKFQTKTITTSVWQTHCRHSIGSDTTPGAWEVRAFLGERILGSAKFTVR
jgi:hypothetical protein